MGSLFFRLDHLFFFCAGAGLDSSTRGAIRMGGKGISALNANQLADYRAAYVGFVLQSCNLIPALTVIENAALVKEIAPNPLSSHDLLRAVGLADHIHSFPSELPGGERRKTQIGTFKALGFRDRLSVGGRMLQGTAADALRPYPPKRMKQLRAEETRRFKALNFGAKLLPVIAAVALGIVALCSLA